MASSSQNPGNEPFGPLLVQWGLQLMIAFSEVVASFAFVAFSATVAFVASAAFVAFAAFVASVVFASVAEPTVCVHEPLLERDSILVKNCVTQLIYSKKQ